MARKVPESSEKKQLVKCLIAEARRHGREVISMSENQGRGATFDVQLRGSYMAKILGHMRNGALIMSPS